jgi:DNA helicase-2/ATP-dependent DNA helicase PcrA
MARQYTLHRKGGGGKSGIDYRAELNEEQYAAVTAAEGRSLVIAGAGSGKTRTLTYRVAWLLDRGVDPHQILLLTFTNKAAREMLGRVRELVPRDINTLWGGTFHSIGNRILRRHAEQLGFTRSFSILDRDDQKSLLSGVIADCKIDTKKKRFPRPDVLASIHSLARNTGVELQRVLGDRYSHLFEWFSEITEVIDLYEERKRESNSMDFDDLLLITVELLAGSKNLRELYRNRFRHILVDEYQDTNRVQSDMIDLLAGGEADLMAVGDDAQSIYSWRGADMNHILKFTDRYKDARVFMIETNYRSVPGILDLSNAAIRPNRLRFEKDLRAWRESGEGKPALVTVNDPNAQAMFVGQRIEELQEQGVPLSEMAVLYRAHYHSMEVQMEMTSRMIPFRITSGLRFFEQAHIKDVATFLRFVTNRRDETCFKRMVRLMPGVGPASATKMWRLWLASGGARSEGPPEKFSDILLSIGAPKKAAKHWEQVAYTLDELAPGGEFAEPYQMIYSVLEGVYDDYIKANFDNYESRRADVEQLMGFSEQFEDINEFLAQMALMTSADGEPEGRRDKDPEADAVTLSSIHQAKGLEWRVVFLIWLSDGMFPIGKIIESDDMEMMEEERRLFYVALTRAKDELYLSWPMLNPKCYSGDVVQRPSRFLDACPLEMMDEWNISTVDLEEDDDYDCGGDDDDVPF